jgi:hypothetical protein
MLLFVALDAAGDRPIKRPQEWDLVGHWVGFDDYHPYFYRLNLQANNTGKLVVLLYPKGEPSIYGLRWQLDEKQLQVLDILPLTTNAEAIACSVTRVDFRRMNVVIGGISNAWKRTAMLLNEKSLSSAIIESAKHESKPGRSQQDGN